MRDACLLVFTKPVRPGRVKTRLIAAPGEAPAGRLTAAQAAELHGAFLDDLSARLAAGSFDLNLAWALAAGAAPPASRYPSVRQTGADLGERLYNALAGATERYALAAAVGSDHPELALAAVEHGLSLLRSGIEVVLGPTPDGGYYFVGVRADSLRPELFQGIEWSTPTVLAATLARCRELSMAVELLEEAADIDTPEDLLRLARRFEHAATETAAASSRCPRTERLLRAWGLVAAGPAGSPRPGRMSGVKAAP